MFCSPAEWASVIKSIGYCKGDRGTELRKDITEHCKRMLDARDIKITVIAKVYRDYLVAFCTGKSGGLKWDTLLTKK